MPSMADMDNVIDLMSISRVGVALPTYPATGAAFTTLTGITATSLYLCQEASGNLADSVGGNTLVAAGTPVYQRGMPDGRLGVYYDTSGDKHVADVWTLGSNSILLMAVAEFVVDLTGQAAGIMGRLNVSGASDGLDMSINASTGYANLLCRDTGTLSVNTAGSTDLRAIGGLWLCQAQVDRSGTPTVRARFSRWGGGVATQTLSGSIASHGALDGVLGMEAGIAGYGARIAGNAISWAVFASGAQCEGSGLLAANAVAMGFE